MTKETVKKSKNPLGLWLGIALIIFGLFSVISGIVSLTDNKARLVAPKGIITIEKADSPELRYKGLSGRSSLGQDEGMMFYFDNPSSSHCLVMRDMKFAIDMVWLNDEKEVITIKQNATPDTYPEQIFCPDSDASYVLEIPSGRSEALGIDIGETLRF